MRIVRDLFATERLRGLAPLHDETAPIENHEFAREAAGAAQDALREHEYLRRGKRCEEPHPAGDDTLHDVLVARQHEARTKA